MAMNGIIGENGLVTSGFVFEGVKRFPIISTELPGQKEMMEAVKTSQAETDKIVFNC